MAKARGIRLAGGLLLSLGLSRCVLVVSDEVPSLGSHCRFSGDETQCGACIVRECRSEVDACCGAKACAPTLSQIESCASLRDANCSQIQTSPGELASCVNAHCSGVCVELSGNSITECSESAFSGGTSCSCSESDPPNDFICSKTAFANTVCCAPGAWPALGLECTCRPLECNFAPDGCFCSLVDHEPLSSNCAAKPCCVEGDHCTCRSKGCYAWETTVESCTAAVVGCATGQIQVASCSIRQ